MSSVSGKPTRTKQVALAALCAALYGAISIQPVKIPAIGAGGRPINPEAVLGPVFGIVLGPWLGAFATLLGVIVAIIIPNPFWAGAAPDPWTLVLVPSPVLGSLISGVVSHRVLGQASRKAKWLIPVAVFGVLLVAWFASPVGAELYYYVLPHIVALCIAVGLSLYVTSVFDAGSARLLALVVAVVFCGTMIDHLWGSLMFAYTGVWLFEGLTIEALIVLFQAAFIIFILERLAITALGIFLSVGLIAALDRAGLLMKD